MNGLSILPAISARGRGRTYSVAATLVLSTAAVLQRETSVGTATQLAGRALFGALGLLTIVAIMGRGRIVPAFRAIGLPGLGVAALLAVSSASFITALNHTDVATVVFIQALAPIVAALLGILFLHERVRARTWIAMAIAVGGVGLIVGGPGGHGDPVGDALSLLMCIAFGAMLVLTRLRQEVSMAPAICLSQVIVFVGAAAFARPATMDGRNLAVLAALGIGQLALGFALLAVGARLLPAAEVALITLLEIPLGPLWVWLAVGETPSTLTVVGGAMILLAVTAQALTEPDDRTDAAPDTPAPALVSPAAEEQL